MIGRGAVPVVGRMVIVAVRSYVEVLRGRMGGSEGFAVGGRGRRNTDAGHRWVFLPAILDDGGGAEAEVEAADAGVGWHRDNGFRDGLRRRG